MSQNVQLCPLCPILSKMSQMLNYVQIPRAIRLKLSILFKTFFAIFLGRAGNLKAAAETLKSAESLRISIGADAMRFYLQFVKDYRKKKDSGIFAQLSDLFRNSSNKKK